ncbi:MAG: hypothetical protein JWN52_7836 [Actinomycetia bacterium]|nr:hypothetical protein [Actinomycetes bacterium]
MGRRPAARCGGASPHPGGSENPWAVRRFQPHDHRVTDAVRLAEPRDLPLLPRIEELCDRIFSLTEDGRLLGEVRRRHPDYVGRIRREPLAVAALTTLSPLVTMGLVVARRRVGPVLFSPAPYRP